MNKTRKLLIALLSVACATCCAVGISACSGGSGNNNTDSEIYAVWQAYAEDGGTLSYSEWLESIKGEDGKGIASISKTSSSGNVDTYTITYTDNTTSTFTVTNGTNGNSGSDGVSISGITTSKTDGVTTITVTLSDGTTDTFTISDGATGGIGATGTGIESIAIVNGVYVITCTDGTTDEVTPTVTYSHNYTVGGVLVAPDGDNCGIGVVYCNGDGTHEAHCDTIPIYQYDISASLLASSLNSDSVTVNCLFALPETDDEEVITVYTYSGEELSLTSEDSEYYLDTESMYVYTVEQSKWGTALSFVGYIGTEYNPVLATDSNTISVTAEQSAYNDGDENYGLYYYYTATAGCVYTFSVDGDENFSVVIVYDNTTCSLFSGYEEESLYIEEGDTVAVWCSGLDSNWNAVASQFTLTIGAEADESISGSISDTGVYSVTVGVEFEMYNPYGEAVYKPSGFSVVFTAPETALYTISLLGEYASANTSVSATYICEYLDLDEGDSWYIMLEEGDTFTFWLSAETSNVWMTDGADSTYSYYCVIKSSEAYAIYTAERPALLEEKSYSLDSGTYYFKVDTSIGDYITLTFGDNVSVVWGYSIYNLVTYPDGYYYADDATDATVISWEVSTGNHIASYDLGYIYLKVTVSEDESLFTATEYVVLGTQSNPYTAVTGKDNEANVTSSSGVWYSFTPEESGDYKISGTSSNTDGSVYFVWYGTSTSNSGNENYGSCSVTLEADETYYFCVKEGDHNGTVTFTIEQIVLSYGIVEFTDGEFSATKTDAVNIITVATNYATYYVYTYTATEDLEVTVSLTTGYALVSTDSESDIDGYPEIAKKNGMDLSCTKTLQAGQTYYFYFSYDLTIVIN